MFHRNRVTVDEEIAAFMRGFFADLTSSQRQEPEEVARAYARHVWARSQDSYRLLYDDGDALAYHTDYNASEVLHEYSPPGMPARRRHHVALSVQDPGFIDLTKRVALISDSLVCSHQATDPYYSLIGNRILDPGKTNRREPARDAVWGSRRVDPPVSSRAARKIPENQRYWQYPDDLGMHCPDLVDVGRWLLGYERLIAAGLAWYIPDYVRPSRVEARRGPVEEFLNQPIFTPRDTNAMHRHYRNEFVENPVNLMNYIIKDGRIVDTLGADPITSTYVRLVLTIDVPFIDGLTPGDFSKITIDEFDRYESFKTFLRQRLLVLDDALNEVQSEKALERIGLEIKYEVAKMADDMEKIRRKRRIAVTEAVVGLTGATLVAVYGPVFQQVIATIGASGGLWLAIKALAENSPRELRYNDWYYAWVLDDHRRRTRRTRRVDGGR